MSPDRPEPSRLVELAVSDLGIIEHLSLVLGPAMTALTGETGAGKTLVVGAIDLLLGGRADASMVRTGAAEAVIEGRFEVAGEELICRRVIPADGRSRAYLDGRMATASALAETTASLVDLHGQNAHQSLLHVGAQRDALDRFAGIDLAPLVAATKDCRAIESELASMGGDAGARAREADLLRYQLDELDTAALTDPDEDEALDAEEDLLADAVSHRGSAAEAVAELSDDGGMIDRFGQIIASIDGHLPFESALGRLRNLQAELLDLSAELRDSGEQIVEDPERLDAIRTRRQLLVDLRRKYGKASIDGAESGSGTLADVIEYGRGIAERLEALDRHDARAEELEKHLRQAQALRSDEARRVGAARRAAAPGLAKAVTGHLHDLAMPKAVLEISVGAEDPGDQVIVLLAANAGSPPATLAKVASGGELARAMLALRLVLSTGPPVLVFDEVDAGIGGEAALAVGQALAELGRDHQVLVVTHLPQVAAFADDQIHVSKSETRDRTRTTAARLDPAERVVELSRMLSGTPESERMQVAAAELLARAAASRTR